ncbi:hypothetical protein [Streptomyces sp. NPDC059080]|uniref:hypothetical protein n=1 Tax=Streptomyces sp. NPDC059080 TaxID=3346718 RepID=UPI0036C3FAB9
MCKLLDVVEQTFALLHYIKFLAICRERRTELHDACISLVCGLTCLRCLKKVRPRSCYELEGELVKALLLSERCAANLAAIQRAKNSLVAFLKVREWVLAV